MRRLEQWLNLAPWERRLLLRLAILLPLIGASLRILGYARSRNLLERLARSPKRPSLADSSASMADTAQRLARLVSIAANHGPYRPTCLRQSLGLWWLLRRRGIPAEIHIGVRKDQSDLLAHAWVEHGGQVLNDVRGVTENYTRFRLFSPPDTITKL